MRRGKAVHGRGVVGRGVYKRDGRTKVTYAGQHKDGCACGLGVATLNYTRFDGSLYHSGTEYAEYGPDGWRDGRCVCRWAGGDTGYYLYERGELGRGRATGPGAVLGFIMYTRGEPKARARVCADGSCWYNDEDCAPDDPRLLALIEQVAPVEVHPAVPAPHPQSPATRPQAIVRRVGSVCTRRRWRTPWPPRCMPIPPAVVDGRATQANNSRTAKHD